MVKCAGNKGGQRPPGPEPPPPNACIDVRVKRRREQLLPVQEAAGTVLLARVVQLESLQGVSECVRG